MNRSMPAPHRALVALVAASAALFAPTSVALACGCFTPPVPGAIDNDQYAVNQLAEQIVFEVPGDGTITAHVLIRYNGSPDQFAWLVPVPTAPTLELSENMLFGLIDDATRPNVNTRTENVFWIVFRKIVSSSSSRQDTARYSARYSARSKK